MNQENYYKTYYLDDDIYSCLVICLSYASLYTYLDTLCMELKSHGIITARLLLDQLLITGNNKNRFLAVEYSNGKILPQSASNVSSVCVKYRQITVNELQKRKANLRNSVLSQDEIKLIEDGVAF